MIAPQDDGGATGAASDAGAASGGMADRRSALAAIVASGRATRRRPSRTVWIAAWLVGAVCVTGFLLLLVTDGAPSSRRDGDAGATRAAPRTGQARAAGCLGGGFGVGLGVGFAAGFALGARRRAGRPGRRPSPQAGEGGHSSRKSP